MTKLLQQCFLFFIVVVNYLPEHNLGNSQVSVNRTIGPTLVLLAGNDDIHKSLDEFEICPDQTTGFYGNR